MPALRAEAGHGLKLEGACGIPDPVTISESGGTRGSRRMVPCDGLASRQAMDCPVSIKKFVMHAR
jgi:hypothetical protein